MKHNKPSLLRLSALLLACLLALSLASCKEEQEEIPGIGDAEAEAILAPLLPKAMALMQVFFGEGLPYEEPESTTAYDGVQYEAVLPDAPYTSIAAMKEAMMGVFTADYQADLYVLMFEGYETPEETAEEGEEFLDDVILPRYREENGLLQIDIKYEAFSITASPVAEGARVIRGNATRVVVEVSDGKGGTIRVNLALDGDTWLLDGPIY